MKDSRISGLYKLGIPERIEALQRAGWLTAADAQRLRDGRQVLSSVAADKIIENVVGVFGLPFAIAPNFRVNDIDRMVPLAVEEPSIVAALSAAARLARSTGGFDAQCDGSLLAGLVHITGVAAPDDALRALQAERVALLDAANEVHPRLVARGGGVRDLERRRLELPNGEPLIVVHLLVDTADAMGANLVNTICEALAARIAALCRGRVALRILSNLADRSVFRARVRLATDDLAAGGFDGAEVRDLIVTANDIALVDPHRAATHNKGIMNGIDAVAIATGNDWRAIEAGAHAYAARDGSYQPLTRWYRDDDALCGEIEVPLKVGTVGGTVEANPAASLGLAITGVETARQLAELLAAVGLAQNFAALRALASSGIQAGHMKLHARSVAASAGVPEEHFEDVVTRLVASGEIKSWKAAEIAAELSTAAAQAEAMGRAAGKVILLGEHAAVYGHHALALPLPDAVSASVGAGDDGTTLDIPAWGVSHSIDRDAAEGIDAAIALILKHVGAGDVALAIQVQSSLPRAMGLGSSAAVAVAVTRAICEYLQIDAGDERVNDIAFECEKLAHGTPSGVDNTIATYGRPMLFRNEGRLQFEALTLTEAPPLVIASSHLPGLTSEQVAAVRGRFDRARERYDAIFREMDAISVAGARCLQSADYRELGMLMNICHGLLNAIGVSTPELEQMIAIARTAGAAGAKLTGGGGGGSIVALCPGRRGEVREALELAGYRTLEPE